MLTSIADLFYAGAQYTIARLIGSNRALTDIMSALRERYGNQLQVTYPTLNRFVQRVAQSNNVSIQLTAGQPVLPSAIPQSPTVEGFGQYQYDVVGNVEIIIDPVSGATVKQRQLVRIYSDRPLTTGEIRSEAIQSFLLAGPYRPSPPNLVPGNDPSRVLGVTDITIIGTYRR